MASMLIPIATSLIGGAVGGGPGGAANAAAGALTYNPPVSQTNPGAFNPPSGSGIAYNYIPTGGPAVDTGTQQQITGNQGVAQDWMSMLPAQVQQALQLATNNQQHSNVAGSLLTDLGKAETDPAGNLRAAAMGQLPWTPALQAMGVGQQQVGAGQQQVGVGLQGQGLNFNQQVLQSLPQFQQILAMGMDPQQALYQRTQQQVSEQQNAQLAKMGLGGSGAGAGIAQQGINNFNIDWQNQQLGRALQALQGYSGAMSGAGGQLQSGGNVVGTGGNQVIGGTNIQNSGTNTIRAGQDMQGAALGQLDTVNAMGRQGAQDITTGGQLPLQATAAGSAVPASIYQAYLSGTDPTTARALQYLQSITNSSQVANNAASAQVGANATQNGNAASALAPLLQGGFNAITPWLQSMLGG